MRVGKKGEESGGKHKKAVVTFCTFLSSFFIKIYVSWCSSWVDKLIHVNYCVSVYVGQSKNVLLCWGYMFLDHVSKLIVISSHCVRFQFFYQMIFSMMKLSICLNKGPSWFSEFRRLSNELNFDIGKVRKFSPSHWRLLKIDFLFFQTAKSY